MGIRMKLLPPTAVCVFWLALAGTGPGAGEWITGGATNASAGAGPRSTTTQESVGDAAKDSGNWSSPGPRTGTTPQR